MTLILLKRPSQPKISNVCSGSGVGEWFVCCCCRGGVPIIISNTVDCSALPLSTHTNYYTCTSNFSGRGSCWPETHKRAGFQVLSNCTPITWPDSCANNLLTWLLNKSLPKHSNLVCNPPWPSLLVADSLLPHINPNHSNSSCCNYNDYYWLGQSIYLLSSHSHYSLVTQHTPGMLEPCACCYTRSTIHNRVEIDLHSIGLTHCWNPILIL